MAQLHELFAGDTVSEKQLETKRVCKQCGKEEIYMFGRCRACYDRGCSYQFCPECGLTKFFFTGQPCCEQCEGLFDLLKEASQ